MKKRALALLLSLGMLLTASSAAVTVVVAGGAVASATDYRPTYTVVFYLLGGTVDGKTTTALVTDRETGKLPYLPTPERPNYRFDGWFTEPNGGRQITIDDVYTGSIDVYAHWTQVGASFTSPSIPVGAMWMLPACGASRATSTICPPPPVKGIILWAGSPSPTAAVSTFTTTAF